MGQSKRRHIGQLPVSHGKFINSHSKSSRFAHRFGLLPLHNHIHAIRKNKRTNHAHQVRRILRFKKGVIAFEEVCFL